MPFTVLLFKKLYSRIEYRLFTPRTRRVQFRIRVRFKSNFTHTTRRDYDAFSKCIMSASF